MVVGSLEEEGTEASRHQGIEALSREENSHGWTGWTGYETERRTANKILEPNSFDILITTTLRFVAQG